MSYGTRDTGIPFWGESLALDFYDAVDGATPAYDSDNGSAVRFRAGTITLTAGDSLVAYVVPELISTLADDPAVISWVLVGASGSASVQLTEGLDPAFGGGPSACTTPLGTHTLGTGDLVVASSIIGLSDLAAAVAAPALFIEVLSGTVDLTQVKVRVWPPGGAVGSWVGQDATSETAAATGFGVLPSADGFSVFDYAATGTDPTVLWQTAEADARGDYIADTIGATLPATVDITNGGDSVWALTDYLAIEPDTWRVDVGEYHVGSYMLIAAFDTPIFSVPGETSYTAPDEVPGDPVGAIRAVGGGPLVGGWGGWVAISLNVTETPGIFSAGRQSNSTQPMYASSRDLDLAPVYTYIGPGYELDGYVPWAVPDTPIYTSYPPNIDDPGDATPTPIGFSTDSGPYVEYFMYPWSWVEGNQTLPENYTSEGGYIAGGGLALNLDSATFTRIIPAHEIWVPGGGTPPVTVVLPLRQKQRDDGLALSGTPRWRARTSRQGSNRWRGYL